LRPHQIELELTESTLMEESERSTEFLARLRELGMKLSIDDFGIGYSSLSYLKRQSISTLKIDRSFVRDLEHDPNDEAIVTAIVAMSHKLNLDVVAEGVETLAQAAMLQRPGCDLIHGHWLSPPLAADDTLRFASRPIKVLEQLARPALTVLDSGAGTSTTLPYPPARGAASA
jgi:EAL domain-containing protein (putative c-di-GMP-specific phosphodiesterase class I)